MQTSTQDDNGLHYRFWPGSEEPKGVVMIVHGLGEHCERYDTVANSLNTAGFAVGSMDLPGHGHSQGDRGHIAQFSDYEAAALSLHSKLKTDYPNLPIFLLGHSMGGLIAAHLLLTHQDKFVGALLSGAAIQSPQEPPAFQVVIIKIVAAILPKLGMLQLDASGISRDPKVVEKYMNDPLVNKGKLSARLLVEMFKTMDECVECASNINLPIRIMHGSADDMTAPEGSQLLFDSISSDDKEIEIYDGLMHEILNEPEGPEITEEIIAWMQQRLEK